MLADWFDFKREKPSFPGPYLVCLVNYIFNCGKVESLDVFLYDGEGSFFDAEKDRPMEVTHWMYLPDPPKILNIADAEKILNAGRNDSHDKTES